MTCLNSVYVNNSFIFEEGCRDVLCGKVQGFGNAVRGYIQGQRKHKASLLQKRGCPVRLFKGIDLPFGSTEIIIFLPQVKENGHCWQHI